MANVTVEKVLSNPELAKLQSVIILGLEANGQLFAAMSGDKNNVVMMLEGYLEELRTWEIQPEDINHA